MKTLLLLFFLAGGSIALADENLLTNGDFSNGVSHWEGDCHGAGSSTDDSGATSGIVVKLKPDGWTRITQEFEGKPGNYLLTLIYSVSPGTKHFPRQPGTPHWSSMDGFGIFTDDPGSWMIIVKSFGGEPCNRWITPPILDASAPHTVTKDIELESNLATKKGFFLGFPPGEGTINIQSITLVPKNS